MPIHSIAFIFIMALFSTPSHTSTSLPEEQNAIQEGSWEQHVSYCTEFVKVWLADYRNLESLRSSQAEMGEINELHESLGSRVAECCACAKKCKSVGTEKEEMMRNGFITMEKLVDVHHSSFVHHSSYTPLPVWLTVGRGVVAKPVKLLDIPMSVTMLAYQLEHGFDRPAGEPPFMSLVCGYYENVGVSPSQFFEMMGQCALYLDGAFRRTSEFSGVIVAMVNFSEVAIRVAMSMIVPGRYIVEYNRYSGDGFGYVSLVSGFKNFCVFHRLFVSSTEQSSSASLPPFPRPPAVLSVSIESTPFEHARPFVTMCLANDLPHLAQNMYRPEVRDIVKEPAIMTELFDRLLRVEKPEHYYGWTHSYCILYIFEKIFEEHRDLVQEGLVGILDVVEGSCDIPAVLACIVRLRSVIQG